MTWDLFAMRTPEGAKGIDDLENYTPQPIAGLEDVKRRLKELVPDFQFEPESAVLKGEQFCLAVGYPESAPILSLDITVTGRHCEQAAPLVARIIDAFGISALDTASGRIIRKEAELRQSLKDFSHGG